MTKNTDRYLIHFFLTAKRSDKKEMHMGIPVTLEYESQEKAISFLESQNYKIAPVLKNLHYNFYKPIDTPHGEEVYIYATVSLLTTEKKVEEMINNISSF